MSDLISRQAVLDILSKNPLFNAYGMIVHLPSAQSEQKKGEWKPHPTYRAWDVCTACGIGCKRREYGINPDGSEYVTEESYRYCPNCGAKMVVNDT